MKSKQSLAAAQDLEGIIAIELCEIEILWDNTFHEITSDPPLVQTGMFMLPLAASLGRLSSMRATESAQSAKESVSIMRAGISNCFRIERAVKAAALAQVWKESRITGMVKRLVNQPNELIEFMNLQQESARAEPERFFL